MAKRKQDEARLGILTLWPRWAAENQIKNATYMDGMAFFAYIQNERPDLLEFRFSGADKWQLVKGWLANAKLIS